MWLRIWRKLFPPIEVKVTILLPEWINNYPNYARENEKLKLLLEQFHEAYRNMMKTGSQSIYAGYFYLPAKQTAVELDIPIWKNITPPNRNII